MSMVESISVAAAILVASSAAFSQAAGTTGAPEMQNNSATLAPPSGTDKAPAQNPLGTTAAKDGSPIAAKQNDSKTSLPESKTGGKTTAQRDAE